ncbi:hypothetical protein RLP75_004844 [Escherichia coli]|nr:hypothetical protein [Escherichia coli]
MACLLSLSVRDFILDKAMKQMSLLLEKCRFYVEPIYSPSGKLYGMEMLTHFYDNNVKLNPQTVINSLDYRAKKSLLKKQLLDIKLMSKFFSKK